MDLASVKKVLTLSELFLNYPQLGITRLEMSSKDSYRHYCYIEGNTENKNYQFSIDMTSSGYCSDELQTDNICGCCEIKYKNKFVFRIYFDCSPRIHDVFSTRKNFASAGYTIHIPQISAQELVAKNLLLLCNINYSEFDNFDELYSILDPALDRVRDTTVKIMKLEVPNPATRQA